MRLAPVLCRVAGVSCSMWTIFRIITTWKVHSQEAAGQLPFFSVADPGESLQTRRSRLHDVLTRKDHNHFPLAQRRKSRCVDLPRVAIKVVDSVLLAALRSKSCTANLNLQYGTTPRSRNHVNRNHLDQGLSNPQENRNSLTWVLVALPACFACPD